MKILVLGMMLGAATVPSADWTQWRGPGRDGVSADGGGLARGALGRRWSLEVGAGQSGPVVAGDAVFVFSREGEDEVVRAVDLATGKARWRQAYPAPYRVYRAAAAYGDGPKSTPVVHDGRLFTLGISGILSAFNSADGRPLWRKDFVGRFPATAPPFGTSMSPLVAGGLLIAHAGGHDGGALLALDPATGDEKWTLGGDGPSYSSPILAVFEGQEQLVVQVHRRILGVDPRTGVVSWSVPFVTPCDQNIVTPLQAGDMLIVSSLDNGTSALRVKRNGTQWKPEVAWHTREVSMYMSSPVLAGGRVLGLSHRRKGQYFALDPATGAVQWTSEGGQGENAAFVVAGDAVLVLEGDGELFVLPAGATTFAPAGRHQLGQGETLAHPVPTRGGLLVREGTALSLHGPGPGKSARR